MIKKASTVFIIMLIVLMTACSAPAAEKPVDTPAASSAPAVSSPDAEVSESVSASTTAEEKVVFTDEDLEKRVREQMNKPEGDITAAEAEAVEDLNLRENEPSKPSPRIEDISALKYFKNLKGIDLSYHNIKDLSPLAGLTKLEALQIWGAESIENFSALEHMTHMLDLLICSGRGTQLKNEDMQYLAGMTNIEMIWFQGAKELTDISVVSNFKKMYRLNVDYTGVSDISPAAGLTTLVEVDLRGSKVSDVSPLKGLANLKKLFLEDCPVKDYSPLKEIYPNLEEKDFKIK